MFNDNLRNNEYPGRGMILGATPNGENAVQVYWTMGRSENSKKRKLVLEDDRVRTVPTDTKIKNPELIIYNAALESDGLYIVSNGIQTDAVLSDMRCGLSLEQALEEWRFEDDPPINTPRITGVSKLSGGMLTYQLSIVKPYGNDPAYCFRQVFSYDAPINGAGHCIHTYAHNGDPCPSFMGEPFLMEMFDDMEETADYYWNMLSHNYRVGLLVKFINISTWESRVAIRSAIA